MNVRQLYQVGLDTEKGNVVWMLSEEAQSGMNVLRLYQDGWDAEKDNEG